MTMDRSVAPERYLCLSVKPWFEIVTVLSGSALELIVRLAELPDFDQSSLCNGRGVTVVSVPVSPFAIC